MLGGKDKAWLHAPNLRTFVDLIMYGTLWKQERGCFPPASKAYILGKGNRSKRRTSPIGTSSLSFGSGTFYSWERLGVLSGKSEVALWPSSQILTWLPGKSSSQFLASCDNWLGPVVLQAFICSASKDQKNPNMYRFFISTREKM